MVQRWYYSVWMLLVYLSVFLFWKFFPSRMTFLFVGSAAVAFLIPALRQAHRGGYFANRVDLFLHGYVVVDLVLETFSFEAFRLFEHGAVVTQFHNNTNFVGCSLAFTLLVGGYHWLSTQRTQRADGAAYGQTGI